MTKSAPLTEEAAHENLKTLKFKAQKIFRQHADLHDLPPEKELFRQDGTIRDAYLIASGLVKMVRLQPDGQETIVDLRAPGRMLELGCFIANLP